MLDKLLYKFFGMIDDYIAWVEERFTKSKKKKKKKKNKSDDWSGIV